MKKTINILRIIGQFVSILIFGFAGGLIFEFRIPGHHTFTDNDSMILFLIYSIFIVVGIGLILNSITFREKNHWKKFRTSVLIFIIGFFIVVLIPRESIIWITLGQKESVYTRAGKSHSDFIWIKLELFKNKKFLSSTSNGGELTVENIGTYELTKNSMNLIFENEKSDFIGKKYKIVNDTIYCIDCKSEIKLIKN